MNLASPARDGAGDADSLSASDLARASWRN